MLVSFLYRRGYKVDLETVFQDAKMIKSCNCCKVNGFVITYKLGNETIHCQLEDNTYTKEKKELIEWFLN